MKLIIFVIILLSADLFSADFFSSFSDFSGKLYQGEELVFDNASKTNGWSRIFSVYTQLYDHRLMRDTDIDKLEKEITLVIEDISDERIKVLSPYEKELLKAILTGSRAYLKSADPSFSMFRSVRKSKKLFVKLSENYKTPDTGFGLGLSEIATGLYFQDSFWVNSVFGYEGDISEGIKLLDDTALNECFTRVEANMFLIEYYAQILGDHVSSLRYSKKLTELFPKSKYFKYLYAVDLYHTGKIQPALLLFREINNNINNKFYAFEYESIIYEAKCLYITGDSSGGDDIIKYASIIHDGYILEKFRNEWKSSVKIRQDVIYRIQYYSGLKDSRLNDDELKRTALILFDHGYFRETNRLTGQIKNNDPEISVLNFRTSIIMEDWKKAQKLLKNLEEKNEEYFNDNKDVKRLLLLKNVVLNYNE